ncbi:hypothetical protein AAXE64_08025 [Priestia megaterium]
MKLHNIKLNDIDSNKIINEINDRPEMTPERKKFIKECLDLAKKRNENKSI